jgi:hypothetical protein
METPPACEKAKAFESKEEEAAYRLMYARWFCFCHIPSFCLTFKRYTVPEVFGRKFLLATFEDFRRDLDKKIKAETSSYTDKAQRLTSKYLPKFLDTFEKALYEENLAIWEPNLTIGTGDLPDFVTKAPGSQSRVQTLRAARLQDGLDINA